LAVLVVMLMPLLPLAISPQAIQQLPLARHDQNHESALAAAEAGVDDYLTNLAQNQNYCTYSARNPDPAGNTAFTACTAVPAGNPNNQYFRYNVNTSQTASTGIVYL